MGPSRDLGVITAGFQLRPPEMRNRVQMFDGCLPIGATVVQESCCTSRRPPAPPQSPKPSTPSPIMVVCSTTVRRCALVRASLGPQAAKPCLVCCKTWPLPSPPAGVAPSSTSRPAFVYVVCHLKSAYILKPEEIISCFFPLRRGLWCWCSFGWMHRFQSFNLRRGVIDPRQMETA